MKKSGSKHSKKHGRQARKPAHVRYTIEKRWIKNKEKRIKKTLKHNKKGNR